MKTTKKNLAVYAAAYRATYRAVSARSGVTVLHIVQMRYPKYSAADQKLLTAMIEAR